jgi:tetratricopeptide (TPR) repeat protein
MASPPEPTLIDTSTAKGSGKAGPSRLALRLQRPNDLIVLLIAAATVFGALVAYLQVRADTLSLRYAREGQAQALTALRDNVEANLRYGYETNLLRSYSELRALAYLANSQGETEAELRLREAAASLRDQGELLQPPYFEGSDGLDPDQYTYFYDRIYRPYLLAGERGASLEAVGREWSARASAYQTIITLTAVTLFFYGLSLTLEGCLKWAFVGLGSLNIGVIGLWALAMLVFAIRPVPDEAITAFADGSVATTMAFDYEYYSFHDDAVTMSDRAIGQLDRAIAAHDDYALAYLTRADAHLLKGEALLLAGGDAGQRRASLENAVADYQQAIELGNDGYHGYWNMGWAYYLLGDYQESLAAFDSVIRNAPEQQFGARLDRSMNLLGLGEREAALAEVRQAIEQAAAAPSSDDVYYFRQAIRNLSRLQKVFNHAGMGEMLLLLKEAFVSYQTRGTAAPGPTNASLSTLTFSALLPDGRRQEGVAFPAGTSQVFLLFDYAGLADGERVATKIYWEGREQPYMNESLAWRWGDTGRSDDIAVQAALDPTYQALGAGIYQVEVYVEGNLLAESAFTISP